jgi:hypothetical protein
MPSCAGTGAGAACMAALLGRPPGALNTGAVAGVDAGAKAARLGLLCADEAFCRAMLASLSKMMFGTAWFADGAAATLLPEPSEAKGLGGGLPGGVVEASVDRGMVRANWTLKRVPGQSGEGSLRVNLLVGLGAFSLSLKELTIEIGNVWPFSQISTSFLIFSF